MPGDGQQAPPGKRAPRKNPAPKDALRGKVRAGDPFELIRWLAMSQPDPRKALSELVQNSLDAGARAIQVTRIREDGKPCLKIFDDGEGVIPEMTRPEALRYIATHVGHSRKRSLSPEERLALMTQGQYGIGLLGFWSLGEQLEMRTAVPGHRPHRLILYRDRPSYLIEPLRERLSLGERWTEVVVEGLHREALSALHGRRAAEYLASELRGQLQSREVSLVVEDRMSRGRAPKRIDVRPPRFAGERLEIGPVEVPGHPPLRMEMYVTQDGEAQNGCGGLAVYSRGTMVASGFDELGALGLNRAPWIESRLSGIVDFPSLRVAPGSRRGIVVDETSGAFVRALAEVEPVLVAALETVERRRAEELDRSLLDELQRAFRDLRRHRPRYTLLPVSGLGEEVVCAGSGEDRGAAPAKMSPGVQADGLLPPGPFERVEIRPAVVRIAAGGTRRVRATGVDATGRPVESVPSFEWELTGPVGTIVASDSNAEVILHAADGEVSGALQVTARDAECEAMARVDVEVLQGFGVPRGMEGVPRPQFVERAGESWRSRLAGKVWQVNAGHRDYRSVAEQPSRKLRYLAMLFAKEVVLASNLGGDLERPLEQLIELSIFAEGNFTSARSRRRK